MPAISDLPARATATKPLAILDPDIQVQRDAAAQALDCLQRGLIVADERCSVLFCNHTAEKILSQNDGLILRSDGLYAGRPRDSADLRGLIRYAATPGTDSTDVSVLSLWRPSLKRVLLMRIAPIALQPTPFSPALSRAALFVHDPAVPATINEEALSRLFGLTRAEGHLVRLLVEGMSLQESAVVLGVSLNTIRTHLKHVFLKTDTNRQTQLVSMLLGSVIQSPDIG